MVRSARAFGTFHESNIFTTSSENAHRKTHVSIIDTVSNGALVLISK
jgi:hypothetical protein